MQRTGQDLLNFRILIADGFDPMRKIYRQILMELGVRQFECCSDGEQVLECLRKLDPHILITECNMSPMDGFELTRVIRAGEAEISRELPIIMVTAHTEMDHVENARDAGVTEVLAKPISAILLFTRIAHILRHPRPFITSDVFIGPDRRRSERSIGMPDRRSPVARASSVA